VVNGLRHSLDLLIGEAVKISLGDEVAKKVRPNIKFPFPSDIEKTIDNELNDQRQYLTQSFQDAIQNVFDRHSHYQYYLRVIRQASNNSKHWKLEPIAANAYAVQIDVPGEKPQITDIPKDHFLSGEPFEWLGPASNNIRFIAGLQFADFPGEPPNNPMPPSPDDVFNTTKQYVSDMIGAFESAA
jgi:hypothetical protein